MCSDCKRELNHNNLLSPSSIFLDNVSRIFFILLLRNDDLRVLQSAHQGVTAMTEQAKSILYSLGITNDFQRYGKIEIFVNQLNLAILDYLQLNNLFQKFPLKRLSVIVFIL